MGFDVGELLRDLEGKVKQVGMAELGMEENEAKRLGERIADIIAGEWGGQNLYIPIGLVHKRTARNARIFEEFTGNNVPGLARKYGLSIQAIYRIIKSERAKQPVEEQKATEKAV